MGYRGKTTEQNRARDLRAQGWTYNEICAEVGVSKSSVSLWCRDVPVDTDVWARKLRESRRFGARTRVNSLAVRRQQQIEQLRVAGRERVGRLSEEAFLVAGTAL
jgi:transcriptional regulator with XRE-family HTH domain